ncbi:superoxide oxidase [Gammaproteobacteria bacterium]
MLENDDIRYGLVSRMLHWGMALIIVGMIGIAAVMVDMDKDDPLRLRLFGIHKSFGVLVLLLTAIRIIWLRISQAPPLPIMLVAWERALAKIVHSLLYLLMLLVPIAGYVMSITGGYTVNFFGLFDLPILLDKNHDTHELFEEVHELLAWTFTGLILLHFVGALKHRFIDSDEGDVMKRMLG